MSVDVVTLGQSEDPGDPDARMSVRVVRPVGPANGRLVLISHGRNGAAEAPHIGIIAEPYLLRGYTAVIPDLCASHHNGSAGTGDDFTIGLHVRDTRRALLWAMAEATDLSCDPDLVALAGHSMGGYAVSFLAATEFRTRVRHVLAAAPFTSGRRQLEARARLHPQGVDSLRSELPRALTDWPQHDIFAVIAQLSMPVSTVVGVLDTVTPEENVLEFNLMLPLAVDHVVLDGAHHCLEGGPHTAVLTAVVDRLDAAFEAQAIGKTRQGFASLERFPT